MRDKLYFAVVYMFVVTAFFASILIGFARLTRGRVEANEQLNFERAVVQAFPEIQFKNDLQVHQIFVENFEKDEQTGTFKYIKDGQLAGYAIPFSGQGYWDDIEGVIGIAADKRTIRGVDFYEQNETPGLGARIDEDEFRKQFVDKKIDDTDEPIGIVSAAKTPGDNEVHAVTGATQTSVRLETLMNRDIRKWLDAMQNRDTAP